jgi:uncharacterized protein (TIGR02246 family)
METHENASDEAAVRSLVEIWANAVRRKDLAGILAHHAPDMLMFDVPPPLQSKGLEAYRQTWDVFFSWSHDPVVYAIDEMSVTCGHDVAFVAAVMRCSGREKSGQDIALEFRMTMGLRKIDGQWIVMHEHHSVPATS